jgi:uncharacterized protein (DUF433 family)
MKWQNYIVSNDNVILGKPAIKGTRIAVEFIIDRLADGWTEEDILTNYPNLTRKDLLAVFAYLSDSIKDGLLLSYPPKSA